MPFFHQDNSGSKERPRSLAELLGVDTARGLLEPPPAQPHEPLAEEQRASGGAGGGLERTSGEWWGERDAGSPQAAHTPRALVPANCFPPQPSRAYASYSESARPGGWGEGPSGLPPSLSQNVSDLVASLRALSLPSTSQASSAAPGPSYQPYEERERRGWSSETWRPPAETERPIMRRASFCGSMSPMGIDSPGPAQWRGFLAPRCTDLSSGFSPKLFLGGLPWDINEATLMHALRTFHPLRVEWPGREVSGGAAAGGGTGGGCPRGYAYVTLESERWVRALLAASRRDRHDWYYRISSRKIRCKEVQVIPWALADSSWSAARHVKLEVSRTVFVGALHGMLCARALAIIMNDLFQGVVFAGIDTDKNKYPIGSGRVMFDNINSYLHAVSVAYVDIRTEKFTKRIQVDPYLEDSICSICNLHQGPYFCRDPGCFTYYCRMCWSLHHQTENHKPLMRNSRGMQLQFPVGAAAQQPPPPHHNGQSALYDVFYPSRALASPPPVDYSQPSTSNAHAYASHGAGGDTETERAGAGGSGR